MAREVQVRISYDGEPLTTPARGLIVDGTVLVENKSNATLRPTTQRQTLNYLRATTLQVALILHFGPAPTFHRPVHTRKAIRKAGPTDTGDPEASDVRVTPP